MAQPNPFDRFTSFTQLQSLDPDAPLPGAAVDAEFNRVKSTLDQILANLKLIQRDDTQLANVSVGFDQLKAEVDLGFNPPTDWSPDTQYFARDTVFYDAKFWRCEVTHVSAAVFEPAKFSVIADFTDATTDAQAARDAALAAQAAAETAQSGAETAQSGAETAQSGAEAAQTGALAAQGGAETAQAAANGSAADAATSAAAALASKNSTEAYLDEFQSVWLGVQASDPTEDLNGDPLVGGELYLNSVSGLARAYNTVGGWRDVGSSADVQHGTITTDGSAGPYTLPTAPLSKYTVFANMNGNAVLWDDYEIAGNELTFNYTPPAGLTVDFAVLGTAEIGVPSAETVAFAQLTTDVSELALMRQALEASGPRPFRWNHLINGDFSRNTRAQATYSGSFAGYTADRWYWNGSGSTATLTPSVSPTSIFGSYTYFDIDVTGANDNAGVWQRVPDVRKLAGMRLTLQFAGQYVGTAPTLLKLYVLQHFGTGGAPDAEEIIEEVAIPLTATWDRHTFSFDVPSVDGKTLGTDNNSRLEVRIANDASETFRIQLTRAALVEGDVLPDEDAFHDRGALEDCLCETFCERISSWLWRDDVVNGNRYGGWAEFRTLKHRIPDITGGIVQTSGSWDEFVFINTTKEGVHPRFRALATANQWVHLTILAEAEVE